MINNDGFGVKPPLIVSDSTLAIQLVHNSLVMAIVFN